MNGRVYDPQLGRFLSADPHVQYEADLQNYNRYSYVNNNPLKYTDPSGYFIRKLLKSISPNLATGISLVLSVIPGGQWAAAAFNAAYARANGGNFGEIAFSFGIGYIGGRLGQSAAIGAGFKVTSKGLATAGGQAFSSAVSGAFTGAINAVVTDTKLSRGIFQGAATGAAIGAITHAIKSSPEQGTVQADKGTREQKGVQAAAQQDNPFTPKGRVLGQTAGGDGAPLGLDEANRGRQTEDRSDLKFTMGLQGGARVGIMKLLGARVDLDLGSREFSITGKEFVNENYSIGLDVLGFSLQLDASKNVEVFDFRPGVDSVSGILRNHSFEWKPGIGTPWNTSASEFWKIDFGASLLFGVEGSLDFNATKND